MIAPADDLDRIMLVMAAAFDPLYNEAWTRRQVEDALLFGNCHYLLIDECGNYPDNHPAAGFSLLRTCLDEEELLLFAVDPRFRNRGLGLGMLRQLAKSAPARGISRILLEMRKGNPAGALYTRFGFRPIGERPNYYSLASGDRVNAVTYAYDIPGD